MTKAPLCRCNKCYSIYIDNNPQINTPTFDVKEYPKLKQLDEDEGFYTPELYWGCPICKTDGYLTDITDAEMIQETEQANQLQKETNIKVNLVGN